MEKKNRGKIIIIVVLVLAILGLGGYIVYDKKNNENKITEYKNQINDLEKQVKDLKKQIKEYKENSEKVESPKTNDEITLKDLYGTYKWEKSYTNEYGSKLNLQIQLVLNPDGSATYDAGSGYEAEQTKGSYIFKDGKIIYTREYYNQDNGINDSYTNPDKTVTFTVVDKNTLQNIYYDQTTSLKKTN